MYCSITSCVQNQFLRAQACNSKFELGLTLIKLSPAMSSSRVALQPKLIKINEDFQTCIQIWIIL